MNYYHPSSLRSDQSQSQSQQQQLQLHLPKDDLALDRDQRLAFEARRTIAMATANIAMALKIVNGNTDSNTNNIHYTHYTHKIETDSAMVGETANKNSSKNCNSNCNSNSTKNCSDANDCDDGSISATLPPLLEAQRSASPRSVAGIFRNPRSASVCFEKDYNYKNETETENENDHHSAMDIDEEGDIEDTPNCDGDFDWGPCLDPGSLDPLPLTTTASADLVHLLHDTFGHNYNCNDSMIAAAKDILPKTKLTFYADRDRDHTSKNHKGIKRQIENEDEDEDEDTVLPEFRLSEVHHKEDPYKFLIRLSEVHHDEDPYKFLSNNCHPSIHSEQQSQHQRKHQHQRQREDAHHPYKFLFSASPNANTTDSSTASNTTTTNTTVNTELPKKRLFHGGHQSEDHPSMPKKPMAARNTKVLVNTATAAAAAVTKIKKTKQTLKPKPASKSKVSIKTKAKSTASSKVNTNKRKPIFATMFQQADAVQSCSNTKSNSSTAAASKRIVEETWDLNFVNLSRFYDLYGHSSVLRSDPDKKLSGWVKRQRNNLKEGKLIPSQTKRLNDLDFVWNRLEGAWYTKYHLLKEFATKHSVDFNANGSGHCGSCEVPTKFDRSLAEWTQRQRREYRSGKVTMTPTRISKLEALPGWSWAKREDRFPRRKPSPSPSTPAKEIDIPIAALTTMQAGVTPFGIAEIFDPESKTFETLQDVDILG